MAEKDLYKIGKWLNSRLKDVNIVYLNIEKNGDICIRVGPGLRQERIYTENKPNAGLVVSSELQMHGFSLHKNTGDGYMSWKKQKQT